VARYRLASALGSLMLDDTLPSVRVELVTTDGTPVALAGIVGGAGELVAPGGAVEAVPVAVDADELVLTGGAELDEAGLWTLELTLDAGAAGSIVVEPAPLVVEVRDGWHTLATARAQWADAPRLDVALYTLLAGARTQCEAYAPALEPGAAVPLGWRDAQLMQARNTWNASKLDPTSAGIGGGELVFRPYPMDQTVRYLLRPRLAIGSIA
jgi:hypothetical protein